MADKYKYVMAPDGRKLRASKFWLCGWPKDLQIYEGKVFMQWTDTPNVNRHNQFLRGVK